MSSSAEMALQETLERLEAGNYNHFFTHASDERKTALENNLAKLIKQLKDLQSHAKSLPEGASSESFVSMLRNVEVGAYAYFVREDFATVSDNDLLTAREGFTKPLKTLTNSDKEKTPVPPITVTAAISQRSRAEQIQTSNAIFILREFKRLIESIPDAITQEGILRLSGSADMANKKFAAYHADTLMTATHKDAFDWGDMNKVSANDVVSTLKRLFRPTAAIPGLSLKDFSPDFQAAAQTNPKASFDFLCQNLPASHLRMLQIMIELMAAVAQNSGSNKMTASNLALATNGIMSTIMNVMDVGAVIQINKCVTYMIENAVST